MPKLSDTMTEGVIAKLCGEDLSGRTVGVQLYGVPNPALVEFLASSGATVKTVRFLTVSVPSAGIQPGAWRNRWSTASWAKKRCRPKTVLR